MLNCPLSGLNRRHSQELEVTPELINAAYKRSLRFGLYWKLKPEERAILFLSRKLNAIKSLTLREILIKVIGKVWPEKFQVLQALSFGKRILLHKVVVAQKIGAKGVAESLLKAKFTLIIQLGYDYLNTPPLYRCDVS